MNRHSNRMRKAAWPALATAAALCLALAPAASALDIADVRAGSGGLDFLPQVENGGFVLTVSGPEGFYERLEFGPGESPSFSIFDNGGGVLPDGVYHYELTAVPSDTQRREAFEANQVQKTTGGVKPRIQTGAFSVVGGAVVAGGETEPGQRPAGSGPVLAQKTTILTTADGSIISSLCVGNDCTGSESFGFDTIRLKENNTRIKFEDTSVGTFPTNDWEIEANDSASGGASYLRIDDVNAGTSPFTVEAPGQNNSVWVDSSGNVGGNVGFGTSTPVLDLHVVSGNSAGLRLEQNGSSGFSAQTYDVVANETNFFIRDVTQGSKLPFRLRPGAPTSSIDVAANGDVGIGTASPSEKLHVRGTDGSNKILIEEASGTAGLRNLFTMTNNGGIQLLYDRTDGANDWQMSNFGTTFELSVPGSSPGQFSLTAGGNLTISGNLVTGGGGTCDPGPCDRVFSPDYEVESIEDHASYMWENGHLWGVGPTPEGAPLNLSKKTTGILHELEKAHIYIEQLHRTIGELKTEVGEKDQTLLEIQERLAALEEARLAE